MKYSIKFTAAELEMLNSALSSGAMRFFQKSKDENEASLPPECRTYDRWHSQTNDLWQKVYAAQKIVRAIEAEASERAA